MVGISEISVRNLLALPEVTLAQKKRTADECDNPLLLVLFYRALS